MENTSSTSQPAKSAANTSGISPDAYAVVYGRSTSVWRGTLLAIIVVLLVGFTMGSVPLMLLLQSENADSPACTSTDPYFSSFDTRRFDGRSASRSSSPDHVLPTRDTE